VSVIEEPHAQGDEELSLLPPDMNNEEYNRELDRELLQIFLDQTQENLSLLRGLTNTYPTLQTRSTSSVSVPIS
jgi:hypothetical protein